MMMNGRVVMFKITLEPERANSLMPEELDHDLILDLMKRVCTETLRLLVEKVRLDQYHYVSMASLIGEWGYLCCIAGPAYTSFKDLQEADDDAWNICYEEDFYWNEGVGSICYNVMEEMASEEPYAPHKDLLLRSIVISHLKDFFE